jgi:hypothetical protein
MRTLVLMDDKSKNFRRSAPLTHSKLQNEPNAGAESHLTRRLFGSMVRRIEALAIATG